AHSASRSNLELAERYGVVRLRRYGSSRSAAWALMDGRWDEAERIADELIAAADAGDRSWTDVAVLCVRAWIRLARGNSAGADADTERAAELARAADIQGQAQAFCVRAVVALAAGR